MNSSRYSDLAVGRCLRVLAAHREKYMVYKAAFKGGNPRRFIIAFYFVLGRSHIIRHHSEGRAAYTIVDNNLLTRVGYIVQNQNIHGYLIST